MTPKISVIVPVYKAEQFLHRCVDSILSQSFADLELILVDDGSPDNSGTICDEYAAKDKRVKVIHKANGGVSTARNVGIENAQGEWLTFIDADDYIEQGFLSIPEDATEDLLIQNYRVQKQDEFKNIEFEKCVVTEFGVLELINENIVKQIYRVPWAKFFRKSIIIDNKLSYIEGVKIGEDTLFMLDYLYYVSSIKYHCEANYVYQADGDVSIKYKLPVNKCIEILDLIIQRYDNLHIDSVNFLNFVYSFYTSLITPRNYASLVVWHRHKTVIRICKAINVDFGIKWAIKYALYLMKQRILGEKKLSIFR